MLVKVGSVEKKVFQNILVDFVFGDVHVFRVLDGLMAIFDEDIEIDQFLIRDLGQSFGNVFFVHFEYFLMHEFDRVSIDSEVVRELQLHHFLSFQPAENSNDLKEPLLLSFDGLFNTELSLHDSALNAFLNFFHQTEK